MRVRRSEYGGFLIMALVIVTMLTLVGLIVMDSVAVDTEAAGAERTGESALYIAEAGVRRAIVQLETNYDMQNGAAAMVNAITSDIAVKKVILTDPDCGNDASCPFLDWYKLPAPAEATAEVDDQGVPSTRFPNLPLAREGWFRVYFKDDEYAESGGSGNGTVLLRGLGRANTGARRIIEVAIDAP